MPLTRQQKEEIVADLQERLQRQTASVFVDLSGMSIPKQEELRSRLREEGVEMVVARKTLVDLALKLAGVDGAVKPIKKPLAIILGYDDVVTPASVVKTFEKEHEHPEVLGGLLGLKVASLHEVETLAQLPGRDELRARVVGSLAAPMRGFVAVLTGTMRSFLSVLQQKANM